MFVAVAVAVPNYLIISYLGLIDNFWVHIVPSLAVPVYLFLMKQYIDDGVPKEILESAKLDGANDLQIISKFVIPLVKPAVATIAILAFQNIWNSGGASLIYLTSESLKTLPYYLSLLQASAGIKATGVAAASSLITFVPNLIIFIVMQSRVMNTMAKSGIK
jgi:ABC transporter, permease protein